jgi:hypothetical protein
MQRSLKNMSSMLWHHKWFLTASVVFGGVLYFALNTFLSRKDSRKRLKTLRKLIDQQLCFGKPNVKLHIVSSVEDWEQVEQQFLETVDSCKLMGLDCEWVTRDDFTGKVLSSCDRLKKSLQRD